jgi:F0F1-type ATP synthase assembly protein I
MTSEDQNKSRTQKIRLFMVSAVVSVVLAGVFAVVEQTTDLNGFTGMWLGVISAVFSAVFVVVLRVQQSRKK